MNPSSLLSLGALPGLALLMMTLTLTLILGGCSTPPSSSASATVLDRREGLSLEQWVESEAIRTGGREFAVTRLQTEGDVDRDGRPDRIWVYRLDGVNATESFEQFLAVQASRDPRRIRALSVGRSGGRSISEVRVVDGTVELNAQEYLPSDQSCCPTGHAKLRIRLSSDRLVFANP